MWALTADQCVNTTARPLWVNVNLEFGAETARGQAPFIIIWRGIRPDSHGSWCERKKVFFERAAREEGCVRTQGVTSRVSYVPWRWCHLSVTSSVTRPRRSWEGPIAHKGAAYCTLMHFTAVTHKCIFLCVQIMINMCFVSGSWGDDTDNKGIPCSDEKIPGLWALKWTNEMIWGNGHRHEILSLSEK